MTTGDPRWERMRELFDRARALPPAERGVYLARQCDDPRLRLEVRSLLEADEAVSSASAGGFLRALDRQRAAELLAAVGEQEVFEPGEEVGRYRVIRPLGRGGMGAVYLARDPVLDRPVALKVLPASLPGDDSANRALAHEARAASATDHPNIATVHDVGEAADGRLFIVMPHYEGRTLREILLRGALPAPQAVGIARQVVAALAAAHARGIIHRDIKPANLIVTPDGLVKVLDFGVATVLRSGAGAGRAGTAAYMSPEQTRGEVLDGRSDLWSVGVVLWEMLTGGRPFRGADPDAVAHAVLTERPRLPPSVPAPLRALVHRCLEKDPDRRFPDAAALLAGLARVEAGLVRRRRFARLGVVAVATALAGTGTALLRAPGGVAGGEAPASAIAILPLATASADTALERLGRELVVTLSATLGEVVEAGVVDAQAVLAAVAEGAAPATRAEVAELARRLGAGRVLQGSLLHVGRDSVRLEADLLALPESRSIVRVAATVPALDLLALTDSVTLGLLRGLWPEGELPSPSPAGLATGSVEALRLYLDGERALGRGDFAAAVAAFEGAFANDSTFWLAYWRSLYPRVYEGTPPAEEARVRAVLAHREELPLPDRMLIEVTTTEGLARRLEAGRALTRAHPTYWPGWYEYGNTLLHDGPYLGAEYEEARVALEEVVRLQPRFAPAWAHLFWLGIYQRDTAAAAWALGRVTELAGPTSLYVQRGSLGYYEAMLGLLRGGGEDPAMVARDAPMLVRSFHVFGAETLGNSLLEYGFARGQIAMADAILALDPPHAVAAEVLLGRARAWASRGAWDSALASARRGAAIAGTPAAALTAYAVAAVGSALGALDPREAGHLRAQLGPVRDLPPADRAELCWLDGIAALARGDAPAVRQARSALAAMAYEHAGLLAGSLVGFARAAGGDTAGAGRILAGLEERKADARGYAAYAPAHPWLSGVNRLLGARFLLRAGERDRASRLLSWHEAIRWGATNPEEWVNRTLEPLALLERGRIEEARGLPQRAAAHYRAFLERLDRPVPALRPLRREAEARLARITTNSTSGDTK